MATTADGKLLVQMSLGLKGRNHRIVLRRFSVNGTLDSSFAAGNAVVPTNPSHSALAGLIRVFSQPGGTSVVAYYAEVDGCSGGDCSERTNFIRLFRYSATGKPIAKASYYTEYWDLYGLAMAPDGGLIVTGDESEYGRETYLRTKPNLKSRFGKVFDEESGPGSVGPPDRGPHSSPPAASPGQPIRPPRRDRRHVRGRRLGTLRIRHLLLVRAPGSGVGRASRRRGHRAVRPGGVPT